MPVSVGECTLTEDGDVLVVSRNAISVNGAMLVKDGVGLGVDALSIGRHTLTDDIALDVVSFNSAGGGEPGFAINGAVFKVNANGALSTNGAPLAGVQGETVSVTSLTGQVAEAQIADGAVTDAKIADVSAAKVTGELLANQIADGAVTDAKVASVSAAKLTGVVSEANLPASLTGQVGVERLSGQVTTDQIADGAVTDAKVAGVSAAKVTGEIATDQIADETVTDAKIASVSAEKVTGQIANAQIQNAAITASKLSAGAVQGDAIGDGSVSAAKLAPAAVTAAAIADGAVQDVHIDGVSIDKVTGDLPGARLELASVDNSKLADGAVDGSKLLSDSVDTVHLADGAATDAKIAAVVAAKVTGQLSTAQIADGAVTDAKVADVSFDKVTGAVPGARVEGLSDQIEFSQIQRRAGGADTPLYDLAAALAADPVRGYGEFGVFQVFHHRSDGNFNFLFPINETNFASNAANAQYARYDGRVHTINVQVHDAQYYAANMVDVETGRKPIPPTDTTVFVHLLNFEINNIAAGFLGRNDRVNAVTLDEGGIGAKVSSFSPGTPSFAAVDGDPARKWTSVPAYDANGDPDQNAATTVLDGADVTGEWVGVTVSRDYTVATYALTRAAETAPVDWTLAASTDGGQTWTAVHSVSEHAWPDGQQTATFDVSANRGSEFRLIVTKAGGAGAVTIADFAVTGHDAVDVPASSVSGKLRYDQLQALSLAQLDGTLSGARLDDGTVTDAKIAGLSVDKVVGSFAADRVSGTLALDRLPVLGDDKISEVSAAKVTGVIQGAQIADGAVYRQQLADDTVVTRHIALKAVQRENIGDDAVIERTIEAGAVTDAKIATVSAAKVTGELATGQIADGAVTDAKIATVSAAKVDGALDTLQIADGAVTDAKIAPGVSTAKLAGTFPADRLAGQVPLANLPAVPASHIADGAVVASKLAAGAVTEDALAIGAVTTSKIANGAVTDGKVVSLSAPKLTGTLAPARIADGSLTDAKIASVSAAKIAGEITTSQIADGAVTNAKISGLHPSKLTALLQTANLADGAVTNAKIASVAAGKVTGAVAGAQIADGAISDAKIAAEGISVALVSGSFPAARVAGELAVANLPTVPNAKIESVAAGKVTGALSTAQIADDAVTDAKIASVATSKLVGAVASFQIQANAVWTSKIRDGNVTTEKIADGAIVPEKLALEAVQAGAIADGAVTDAKIASVSAAKVTGELPTARLANGAVTTAKLADGAVTAVKLANGAVVSGKIAAGAVAESSIGNGAVTDAKIASVSAGKVTGVLASARLPTIEDAKIAGVSASKLVGQVQSAQIASLATAKLTGTIPTAQLENGSVTDAKIAGVSATKLTDGLAVDASSVTVGRPTLNVADVVATGDVRFVSASSAADMSLRTAGVERVRLDATGNVGVGESAPAYKLHVNGVIFATDDVISFSDARLKRDVRRVDGALAKVLALEGCTFVRKPASGDGDSAATRRHMGVIAQQVEAVAPELVHTDADTGAKSVAYGNMAALFIEALKEQQARIERLEERVAGIVP